MKDNMHELSYGAISIILILSSQSTFSLTSTSAVEGSKIKQNSTV